MMCIMVRHSRRFLRYKQALKPVWYFPIAVLLALLVLTALRISGTSIGVYSMLNGTSEQDQGDVALNPRGVRSDEWLVNTQMTVAQATNNFQSINTNIGQGQDMTLVVDAPYREWSQAFKPQNLIFFILPLEYAFAFKWWILSVILILACYFLLIELFPGKILRATLLSLFVGFAPLVFWWYQSITLLPIAYSFLMILLFLRLLKAENTKARITYSLLLTYVLICFALLLYPPFQVPCLIAVGVFMLGWMLENYTGQALKKLLSLWPYFVLIAIVTALAGGAFYLTRKDIIQTITHTVYPGIRIVTSGGVDPLLPFSSHLSPNLQYDEKAASGYLQNQSEASNFIFIAPFLFLPSLYLIIREKRKHNKMLWGLLLINVLLACFLARMHLVTPWLDPLYSLFLLDKVPGTRLLLGLGFAGILQLFLLMKTLDKIALGNIELHWLAIVGGVTSLVSMLVVGIYTVKHFPLFIASYGKVGLFSLWIAVSVFLILQKKIIAGLILLVAFSLLSIYRIHPLYQGLGPITTSETIQAIKSYPSDGRWVVLEDRLIINFPLMAGKPSLNSVHFYPQLALWSELDRDKKYEDVYNRFAHILFTTDEQVTEKVALKFTDIFVVKFEPCQEFLQKNAKYVLSPKELSSGCVRLEKTISLPAKQLFIYKVIPPVQ